MITLLHAGLADRPRITEPGEEIVALGFLGLKDIVSENSLRVADYQREILGSASSLDIAIREGTTLPSITLGVRGTNYKENGTSMMIPSDVYIIDGLQRISALRRFAEEFPDRMEKVTIGAEVRFGTTYESEKRMFQTLNSRRVAVSPNVLLRNMRDKYKSILTIYGLSTNDASSPLMGKVQWKQRATQEELISAMTVVRSMLKLYQHVSTKELGGRKRIDGVRGVKGGAPGIEKNVVWLENKSRILGLEMYRENLITFFEAVDDSWGFRHIEHNAPRLHLRFAFLQGLAMLFSEHTDFWKKNNKLVVPAHILKRLASFPFQREDIARLLKGMAGSGSGTAFCDLLIRHINRGKSTRKLKARDVLIQD